MRVVLDTNVFISGIHWSGPSEKILYSWTDNKFEVITSIEIIEEVIKTLTNFKIPLPTKDILLWIYILAGKSITAEPEEKLSIVKDDPDDNKFIEAAVAGNADYIITQDKHLLKIKEHKNIKIVKPEEFLQKLQGHITQARGEA
jgi:uncharacterized protein